MGSGDALGVHLVHMLASGMNGIGRLTELENECVGEPTATEAKFSIAELLDLPINCVERFRGRVRSLRGDQGGASS